MDLAFALEQVLWIVKLGTMRNSQFYAGLAQEERADDSLIPGPYPYPITGAVASTVSSIPGSHLTKDLRAAEANTFTSGL
jgi:hypothetical protein